MTKSVFSDSYKSLIEMLRKARLEAGVTQIELAQRLGKPQSFVSKVETGERRVDVIDFLAIAHALGLDPAELITELGSQ